MRHQKETFHFIADIKDIFNDEIAANGTSTPKVLMMDQFDVIDLDLNQTQKYYGKSTVSGVDLILRHQVVNLNRSNLQNYINEEISLTKRTRSSPIWQVYWLLL